MASKFVIESLAWKLAAYLLVTLCDDFPFFMRCLIRELGGYDSASAMLGESIVRRYCSERANMPNNGAFQIKSRGHV